MNKKTYINPELEVVMIAAQTFLASSTPIDPNAETSDVDAPGMEIDTNMFGF